MVTEVTLSSVTCASLPHLGAQMLSLRQLLRKPDKVSSEVWKVRGSPHRAAHTPWGTGLCLREQMRYRSGTVPPCVAHHGASASFLTSVFTSVSSTQWELWWPLWSGAAAIKVRGVVSRTKQARFSGGLLLPSGHFSPYLQASEGFGWDVGELHPGFPHCRTDPPGYLFAW